MVLPKRQAALSAAFGPGAGFESHRHAAHQLTWTSAGALRIGAAGTTWVLGRGLALWVPANVEHDIVADGETVMRNLYFDPEGCPVRWTTPTAIDACGLLGHLLD